MKNTLALAGLGSSLLLVVLAGLITGCARMHSYTVAEPTSFLTEKIALEKAQAALQKDGHRPNEWRLTRANNPPTSDSNGVEDVFFDRHNWKPAAGRVHFTDGKEFISYSVKLEGDRVVCSRFRGL